VAPVCRLKTERRLDEAGWMLVVIWNTRMLSKPANESQTSSVNVGRTGPGKAGLGRISPSTDLSKRSIS
jgi:hypothetical protein